MLTQIINAKILTPQGWLKDGSVLMRDNKILEVTNCDLAVIGAELIDAKGMYVVPGGVEIHCHGGGGGDFMEGTEEAFRTAINAHMKHGTTSIFPTLSLACTISHNKLECRMRQEEENGTLNAETQRKDLFPFLTPFTL